MTDQEKDIAIHQSLGRIPGQYFCKRCGNIPISEVTSGGYHDACGSECSREVPKYGECLNAMAEARKVLKTGQATLFVEELDCILRREQNVNGTWEIHCARNEATVCYRMFPFINASAAQHREAYLRTLNLLKS